MDKFLELFNAARKDLPRISFNIGYTKIVDYCLTIEIEHYPCIECGRYPYLDKSDFSVQDTDINVVAAKAYVWLSEYIDEHC